MKDIFEQRKEKKPIETNTGKPSTRRDFLKWSSAAVLTALAFGALDTEKLSAKTAFAGLPIDEDKAGAVDVGKGDIDILNFTYARLTQPRA